MKFACVEDVSEFVLDGTHLSPVRVEIGVPVLSAQNVKHGVLSFETDRFTTNEEFRAFNSRLPLEEGDVLLTIVGTIGRAAVMTEVRPLVFQRSVAIIRPQKERLDPRYFLHATQGQNFQAQLARSTNASSQAGVYLGKLKKIIIPVPPLAEQRRIAEVLDRAEALRTKRRATLAQLHTLIGSIFVDLFGDPIKNQRQWDVLPFESQIESVRYGTGSPPEYVDDGVPFIRATNIKGGIVLTKDLKRISLIAAERLTKCRVSGGELIVVRSGVNTGDAAVVPQELDGAYAAYDLIVRLNATSAVFYSFLINSPQGKSIISKLTRRAAQAHLNADQLRNIKFVAPPVEFRKEFARRVAAVEKLKTVQRKSLAELDALFVSLQHRAFRGEL